MAGKCSFCSTPNPVVTSAPAPLCQHCAREYYTQLLVFVSLRRSRDVHATRAWQEKTDRWAAKVRSFGEVMGLSVPLSAVPALSSSVNPPFPHKIRRSYRLRKPKPAV